MNRVLWGVLVSAYAAGVVMGQPTILLREGEEVQLDNGKSIVVQEIAYHTAVGPYAWAARANSSKYDIIVGQAKESPNFLIQWLAGPESRREGSQLTFEPTFGLGARGELVYSSTIADRPNKIDPAIHGVLDSIWFSAAAGKDPELVARRGEPFKATINGSSVERAWTASSIARFSGGGKVLFLGACGHKAQFPASERGLWLYEGRGRPVQLLLGAGQTVGTKALDWFPVREFTTTPTGGKVWAICNTKVQGQAGQSVVSVDLRSKRQSIALQLSSGQTVLRDDQRPEEIMSMRSLVATDASPCNTSEKWAVIAKTDSFQLGNVVLVNGVPALREGRVINGTTTLVGEPTSLAINDTGDWAVGWLGRTQGQEIPLLLVNGNPVDISGLIKDRWVVDRVLPGLSISSRSDRDSVRVNATVMLRDTYSTSVPPDRSRALISLWTNSLPACCPVDLTGDYMGKVHVPDGIINEADATLFVIEWTGGNYLRADMDNGSGKGVSDGVVDTWDLIYFFDRFFIGCD